VDEGMELRDSSLGWARREEVSRRKKKKSGRIKRGVKALNYRLRLIENHLTETFEGRQWRAPTLFGAQTRSAKGFQM
jgi:hypothetical protein